jgi:hypothetical protein
MIAHTFVYKSSALHQAESASAEEIKSMPRRLKFGDGHVEGQNAQQGACTGKGGTSPHNIAVRLQVPNPTPAKKHSTRNRYLNNNVLYSKNVSRLPAYQYR